MKKKDARHDTKRTFKTYMGELLTDTDLNLPAKKNLVNISQGILISNDTSLKKISENILPKNHAYRNHQMTSKEVISNLHRISSSLIKNDYSKIDKNILGIGEELAFYDHAEIIIDASDCAKPYGKKMEKSRPTPDGSNDYKITNGYETTNFLLKTRFHNDYFLHAEVNDLDTMTRKEREHQIINKIDDLFCKKERLYLTDSGYSGETNLNQFIKNSDNFISRLKSNRTMDLCNDDREYDYTAEILGQLQSTWGMQTITVNVEYNGKCGISKISKITGYLQDVEEELTFIIITSTIGSPMILVTNLPCETLLDAKTIYFKYLSRWRIEKAFKFMKEQYRLEKFHVRTFQSIQNIYKLCIIIFNYLAILSRDPNTEMIQYLIEISLSISTKPYRFIYYKLADGLRNLLVNPNKNFSESMLS